MKPRTLWLPLLCSLTTLSAAGTDGGVTFTNIAENGGAGVTYARGVSDTFAALDALRQQSLIAPITSADLGPAPNMPYGLPGVAIFDADRDGDLDIYVTNGPGVANSLYINQLSESGQITFVDTGAASGAGATSQDSTGVVFGDTDNDGDHDLLVLGRSEPNQFFVNNGDGTFTHQPGSGLEGVGRSATSAAMGDFDNDGLVDVVVANTFDYTSIAALLQVPFALNEHNQVFRNLGGNQFSDVSAASGVEALNNLHPAGTGMATISWSVGTADVDLDGDMDIVFTDDQAGIGIDENGGFDRGFMQVMLNDGTGVFSSTPVDVQPISAGAWMGVDFGDFNCDGNLDMFGSNFGDYAVLMATGGSAPYQLGAFGSRWLLGNGDGTFSDPGVGAMISSAFGWGCGVLDYDNDGDQDIVYHGGLDQFFSITEDNPGAILQNQGCSADFILDSAAITDDHVRRNVRGMALGDLDRNGFVDIVSAANLIIPPPGPPDFGPPFLPGAIFGAVWGGVFDPYAFVATVFAPVTPPPPGPPAFVWTGAEMLPGDLSVELNSGGNGNRSLTVEAVGSADLIPGGEVNRDGFGATIFFTPRRGQTAIDPIGGGASHLSQHSLEATFGMGRARRGSIDVLWPGGTWNRLENVRAGRHVVFPEIPCDYRGDLSRRDFIRCVRNALRDLVEAGVINRRQRAAFLFSMIRAYHQHH